MRDPVAFLLTFRTYGTWLHGDERGSVDRDHHTPGTPYLDPNRARCAYARFRMVAEPLVLSPAMRLIVDQTLAEACEHRGWELVCRAVQTNHVHMVVGFADVPPERMAGTLKARITRQLRDRKLVGADQPVWADRAGSRKWLWSAEQVRRAAEYVMDGQDVPR